MNAKQAREIAEEAVNTISITDPEDAENGMDVYDTTVIFMKDGKYIVEDNGEKVSELDRNDAIRIITENLTA